jgi:DNA-binding response OmpR family regulator
MVNTYPELSERDQHELRPAEREAMMLRRPHTKSTTAKILVVDDEPEILIAVGMRLRAAGYEVVSAEDGNQATQRAIQERPDLIIMDIGMPGGDGHTVARRLANTVTTLLTPVIYLTARTTPADRTTAMSLGAADYITKPFTPEILLKAVEKALNGRSLYTEGL